MTIINRSTPLTNPHHLFDLFGLFVDKTAHLTIDGAWLRKKVLNSFYDHTVSRQCRYVQHLRYGEPEQRVAAIS
jgi:hypothetical protein